MDPNLPTAAVPAPTAPTAADQYATLKSAVLGAQVNPQAGASPLGNFPELAKLYSSAPQLSKIQLGNSASNYNTGIQVSNDKAAAAAAKSASGAGKYQQVQTPDGGFKFYDPNGNEISAQQYAAANGTSASDLLKNSLNPIDQAFRQDYAQLQSYINNKANAKNDPKARSAAQAVETQVRKTYGIDLHQQNPNEVINAFIQAYPTVFGGAAAGKQGLNTLLPSKNSITANQKSVKSSLAGAL